MSDKKEIMQTSKFASTNPAKSVKPAPLPTKETRSDAHDVARKIKS